MVSRGEKIKRENQCYNGHEEIVRLNKSGANVRVKLVLVRTVRRARRARRNLSVEQIERIK